MQSLEECDFLTFVYSGESVKTAKEEARQARRDARRERDQKRQEKFEAIKAEKIKNGTWVEKGKWKAKEKKNALKRKSDDEARAHFIYFYLFIFISSILCTGDPL